MTGIDLRLLSQVAQALDERARTRDALLATQNQNDLRTFSSTTASTMQSTAADLRALTSTTASTTASTMQSTAADLRALTSTTAATMQSTASDLTTLTSTTASTTAATMRSTASELREETSTTASAMTKMASDLRTEASTLNRSSHGFSVVASTHASTSRAHNTSASTAKDATETLKVEVEELHRQTQEIANSNQANFGTMAGGVIGGVVGGAIAGVATATGGVKSVMGGIGKAFGAVKKAVDGGGDPPAVDETNFDFEDIDNVMEKFTEAGEQTSTAALSATDAADRASTSASAASTSASDAYNYAQGTGANYRLTSTTASTARLHASQVIASTSANVTVASTAAHNAYNSYQNATFAEVDASTSASTASTHAEAALTRANAASTHAEIASTHAHAASTHANVASTSAANAQMSQVSASTAEKNASTTVYQASVQAYTQASTFAKDASTAKFQASTDAHSVLQDASTAVADAESTFREEASTTLHQASVQHNHVFSTIDERASTIAFYASTAVENASTALDRSSSQAHTASTFASTVKHDAALVSTMASETIETLGSTTSIITNLESSASTASKEAEIAATRASTIASRSTSGASAASTANSAAQIALASALTHAASAIESASQASTTLHQASVQASTVETTVSSASTSALKSANEAAAASTAASTAAVQLQLITNGASAASTHALTSVSAASEAKAYRDEALTHLVFGGDGNAQEDVVSLQTFVEPALMINDEENMVIQVASGDASSFTSFATTATGSLIEEPPALYIHPYIPSDEENVTSSVTLPTFSSSDLCVTTNLILSHLQNRLQKALKQIFDKEVTCTIEPIHFPLSMSLKKEEYGVWRFTFVFDSTISSGAPRIRFKSADMNKSGFARYLQLRNPWEDEIGGYGHYAQRYDTKWIIPNNPGSDGFTTTYVFDLIHWPHKIQHRRYFYRGEEDFHLAQIQRSMLHPEKVYYDTSFKVVWKTTTNVVPIKGWFSNVELFGHIAYYISVYLIDGAWGHAWDPDAAIVQGGPSLPFAQNYLNVSTYDPIEQSMYFNLTVVTDNSSDLEIDFSETDDSVLMNTKLQFMNIGVYVSFGQDGLSQTKLTTKKRTISGVTNVVSGKSVLNVKLKSSIHSTPLTTEDPSRTLTTTDTNLGLFGTVLKTAHDHEIHPVITLHSGIINLSTNLYAKLCDFGTSAESGPMLDGMYALKIEWDDDDVAQTWRGMATGVIPAKSDWSVLYDSTPTWRLLGMEHFYHYRRNYGYNFAIDTDHYYSGPYGRMALFVRTGTNSAVNFTVKVQKIF